MTVLLDALRLVRCRQDELICDFLGQGPLLEQCASVSDELKGKVEMNLLGTVEYGWPLFNLLDNYDAVIVPSLSNEQPRIVYDAYARAIPVLASDTEGLASCVPHGDTGRLFCRGSARHLADMIEWAAANRPELARMGIAGLGVARSLTHREIHRRRCDVMAPIIAEYAAQNIELR